MSLNVYISGKISGLPHAIALSKFKATESILFSENYVPINPMTLNHTTHDKTWESYMKVCIKELVSCDAIYMMSGYEDSRGAILELEIAKQLGLKIMYEL